MNIALLGYGKMGKAIEQFITEHTAHKVGLIVNRGNSHLLTIDNLRQIDVAIDFSLAESAVKHITTCFQANTPVVSGTTGWLQNWTKIEKECERLNGTLLYSSNFSIGVHLFWKMIEQAGRIMNQQEYLIQIDETHHIQKKDAPSGTAITTAEKLIDTMSPYKSWSLNEQEGTSKLPIFAHRKENVPGTHRVTFENPIDTIIIEHKAKSRAGFVQGAVKAAEFVIGKQGIFTLDDLLNQIE